MQLEVHVDPEVIFIPRVGSLLAAQTPFEDNDPAKVPATRVIIITMKDED
jgi:hypothetical protein